MYYIEFMVIKRCVCFEGYVFIVVGNFLIFLERKIEFFVINIWVYVVIVYLFFGCFDLYMNSVMVIVLDLVISIFW